MSRFGFAVSIRLGPTLLEQRGRLGYAETGVGGVQPLKEVGERDAGQVGHFGGSLGGGPLDRALARRLRGAGFGRNRVRLRHVVHRGEGWQGGSMTGDVEKRHCATPLAALIRCIAGYLFDA